MTPDHANEVRRCARCGEAELVCVRYWQHEFLGIRTSSWTFEFNCQACGAEVTLLPQQEIMAARFMAFMLLPAIIPSIYFFARARSKAHAWSDNPVVTGLVAPLRPMIPGRVCTACPNVAQPTKLGRKQMNEILLGTHTWYLCNFCENKFSVHD